MEDNYLQFAKQTVLKNGPLFLKHFGHVKSSNKNQNPRDWVTKIDKQIEINISQSILKKFPTHQIMGEESVFKQSMPTDFFWIIDPIDGTTNFIRGLPFCCISLALWYKNQPFLGVIYNPVLKQLFWAQQNKGAFLNNTKIHVSQTPKLDLAFSGFGWGRNLNKAQKNFPKSVAKLNKIRVLGSTALEICLVACGVYDLRLDFEAKLWDFAAAATILKEAGGKVTDISGKNIGLTSTAIFSSNGKLHGALLKIFKTRP